MKIAAIIDEFNDVTLTYKDYIQNVKSHTGADYVIAAMSGDFLQQGVPASASKYIRAQKAVEAGVDLVVELPVYATLQSPDTYAFASVALLERLGCVDELAIVVNTDQIDLIKRITMFLFMEPISFLKDIRGMRAQGISFYDARAIASEKHFAGAKEVLQYPENIFATEYGRAMKRMYSTMKPTYLHIDGLSPLNTTEIKSNANRLLYDKIQYLTEQKKERLSETFGSTSMLTDHITDIYINFQQFDQLSDALSTATRSAANIRRYLLSAIIGIRKQDIAICRLYSFSNYARILGCSAHAQPLIEQVMTKSWMPVFIDRNELLEDEVLAIPTEILSNPKFTQVPADSSKQMLLKLDRKAHQLYYSIQ